MFQPYVGSGPVTLVTHCNSVWERSRFEWRSGEPGDPLELLSGYLAYLPSVYEVGRRMLRALPDLAPAVPALVRWTPELAP